MAPDRSRRGCHAPLRARRQRAPTHSRRRRRSTSRGPRAVRYDDRRGPRCRTRHAHGGADGGDAEAAAVGGRPADDRARPRRLRARRACGAPSSSPAISASRSRRALGDGEQLGLRSRYRRQEQADGTARALLLAASRCVGGAPFVVELGRHPGAAALLRGVPRRLRAAAVRRAAGGQRGRRSVARRGGVRRRRVAGDAPRGEAAARDVDDRAGTTPASWCFDAAGPRLRAPPRRRRRAASTSCRRRSAQMVRDGLRRARRAGARSVVRRRHAGRSRRGAGALSAEPASA